MSTTPTNTDGKQQAPEMPDLSTLNTTLEVLGVRVKKSDIATLRACFKSSILCIPRVKSIQEDPTSPHPNETKLIALQPSIKGVSDLTESEQERVGEGGLQLVPCSLSLSVDQMTADEILKKLLPNETEITTSFETVGHIAHMNLRDHLLPHKHLIAHVILKKNPCIRTVVNKTQSIASQFREFSMEVLAGDNDMIATVVEHGVTFRLDYSKVYWNSRLHTEHRRLVDILKPTDVVCDMFAGVGPFAIPAALLGCQVHANDLNPNSYRYLVENAKKNRTTVHAYNMDGRDFVRKLVTESKLPINHVIMNLPGSAVEFLDCFCGIFPSDQTTLPQIHCYCFSAADDPHADAVRMVKEKLGFDECLHESVHQVRDVAPKKIMMCVSFALPPSIAYSDPPAKRQKI